MKTLILLSLAIVIFWILFRPITKKELDRNLEQLRALENNMKIHVGYIKSNPLSIDTEEDFLEVKKEMESND